LDYSPTTSVAHLLVDMHISLNYSSKPRCTSGVRQNYYRPTGRGTALDSVTVSHILSSFRRTIMLSQCYVDFSGFQPTVLRLSVVVVCGVM